MYNSPKYSVNYTLWLIEMQKSKTRIEWKVLKETLHFYLHVKRASHYPFFLPINFKRTNAKLFY